MPPESEASSGHLRVFIGNFITREPSGALCSATQCTENFGSPSVRETATEHLRTLTGTFGSHRDLRVPSRTFGFENSYQSSPAVPTNVSLSGLVAQQSL